MSVFLLLVANSFSLLVHQANGAVIEVTAGGDVTVPTYQFSDMSGNSVATLTADVTNGKITASSVLEALDVQTTSGTTLSGVDSALATKQSTIDSTNRVNSLHVGAGDVDNNEFGYLNGVTSSIQTQLNGKQASGNNILAALPYCAILSWRNGPNAGYNGAQPIARPAGSNCNTACPALCTGSIHLDVTTPRVYTWESCTVGDGGYLNGPNWCCCN